MTYTILDMPQRSPEWYAARLGRLTASRAGDMTAEIKKGEAAARRNLRVQLVLERLTGTSAERDYQSEAMAQGIEREAEALRAYESATGHLVERCGFLSANELMVGASLDGYMEIEQPSVSSVVRIRVVEVKCPLPATHLETLKTGVIPRDYAMQLVHQMWVSGAQEADWVSYHPDFPEHLRLKMIRVPRKEDEITSYELLATKFLREVDEEVEAVNALGEQHAKSRG